MPENQLNETPAPVAPEAFNGLPEYSFEWLNDEHALREEGAYYGLVEGDTQEKENAIRQYFQIFIQSLLKGIEIDENSLTNLATDVAQLEDLKIKKQAEKESWQVPMDFQQHLFYRYLIGITAYALILLFNFGLIYETLALSTKYPLWLSLGVYLFCMLSQIRRVSNVYSSDSHVVPAVLASEERWKVYAEEYGIPLVGALFVVLFGQPGTALQGSMIFLLVLTLFIYAGKGFWQSWFHVQEEFKILQNNRTAKRNKQLKLTELDAEILVLNGKIERSQEEKRTLGAKIRELHVQLARAEAHMVATISYFKSEFDLARSSKRLGIYG
jgi:hypothetical protein